MTLPYQPVGYTPPCAAGLKVSAVLSIVLGGWMWVGLIGMEKVFYSRLIEVELWKYPANAVLFAGIVVSIFATVFWGGLYIGLGIAMWRGRRSVRPLVVVISVWVLYFGLISLPPLIAMIVGSVQQVGMSVSPLMEALGRQIFRLTMAAVAFWYFRSEAMQETFNHYDPGLSWVERRPLVVLGAMFVAIVKGGFGLIDVAGYALMAWMGGGTGSIALAALAMLHSVVLISAVVACLIKPRIGWWLLLGAVLLWFALQLLRAFVMSAAMAPMAANWRTTGIQIEPWRWDQFIPVAVQGGVLLLVLWRWRSEFAPHPTDDALSGNHYSTEPSDTNHPRPESAAS